ncbi:MAG: helix-turn-helix domain-containing protein [Pseudomonadota bacterium]
MSRSYNQDCILAFALDMLGERWTMLILRELFLGPLRFGDIQAALPGIGANLLSKRLKYLEQADLVVGTDGSRARYRLTEQGKALRPVVRAMMLWSIKYFMDRPEPSEARDCVYSDDLNPDSVALAIELMANLKPDPHSNYVAHVFIDDDPYSFFFMNDEMTARRGVDVPAVASLSCDVGTFMKAMRQEVTSGEFNSIARMSGDQSVLKHFVNGISHGGRVEEEVAKLIEADAAQK